MVRGGDFLHHAGRLEHVQRCLGQGSGDVEGDVEGVASRRRFGERSRVSWSLAADPIVRTQARDAAGQVAPVRRRRKLLRDHAARKQEVRCSVDVVRETRQRACRLVRARIYVSPRTTLTLPKIAFE